MIAASLNRAAMHQGAPYRTIAARYG